MRKPVEVLEQLAQVLSPGSIHLSGFARVRELDGSAGGLHGDKVDCIDNIRTPPLAVETVRWHALGHESLDGREAQDILSDESTEPRCPGLAEIVSDETSPLQWRHDYSLPERLRPQADRSHQEQSPSSPSGRTTGFIAMLCFLMSDWLAWRNQRSVIAHLESGTTSRTVNR